MSESNQQPADYKSAALPLSQWSKLKWRLRRGSNPRPPAWQAGTLTNWATEPYDGGNNRDRTCDPLLVRQMLSQLSYASIIMVTPRGIEPLLPPWKGGVLTAWPRGLGFCTSYCIIHLLHRTLKNWRLRRGSNPRPPAWQAGTLTNWATEPYLVETTGIEPVTLCL